MGHLGSNILTSTPKLHTRRYSDKSCLLPSCEKLASQDMCFGSARVLSPPSLQATSKQDLGFLVSTLGPETKRQHLQHISIVTITHVPKTQLFSFVANQPPTVTGTLQLTKVMNGFITKITFFHASKAQSVFQTTEVKQITIRDRL